MKTIAAFAFLLPFSLAATVAASQDIGITLEKSIPLPGVQGRIDHMVVDPATHRLFVAALGNDSVEVLDLNGGKHLKSLRNLKEAQGVGWAPAAGKLFVACGADGALHVFDGKTLEEKNVIQLGDDADNVRYSAATGQIYVGYGDGAIAIVDPAKEAVIAKIKVSSHPESFRIDRAAKHIYVNVPSDQIEVLDPGTMTRTATWKLSQARSNFPMALDENTRRLFIGCRSPAKILVLDMDSGKAVTELDCPGDVDDVFYAPTTKRVYSSGGDGTVLIYTQSNADHYELTAKIATAAGARTSLLSSDESRLYVAVPHRGAQQAEVRVYRVIGGDAK